MKKIEKYVPDIGSIKKMLMIMKATILLICVLSFQTFASTYAQSTKINMSMKDKTFKDVIEYIEEETDYYFMLKYDEEIVSKKVDVDFKDASIKEVLNELLKDTNYSYKLIDRYITISKNGNSVSKTQQEPVSGYVTDSSGLPLPGVSIIIKGTTTGTITDFDGNFNLINVPGDATLVFSFVGMETLEVEVAGQSKIDVSLNDDAIGIEEVVAIGYGVQKKATLTGAVSNVKAEELEKIPASNVSSMLYGRMAGLNVTTRTGTPGVSADIIIRASSSFNNSSPIYVIDGIVRDKTAFDLLDPIEIEEISILKDAAAAAVYGSRSANGAIVVLTKKGKTGEPTISFNSSYSVEEASVLSEYMDNAVEINRFLNNVIGNNTNHWAYWTEAELDWLGTQNGGKGWNWFDEAKENPHDQRYAMNVSGGTQKVRYFISGALYDQKGIVDELNYKRTNLRAKVDVDVSRDLNIGLQLANINTDRRKYNFQYDYGNDGLPDVFSKLFYYNWDQPPYVDGKATNVGWVGNPIEHIKKSGYRKYKTNSQEAIITAKYKVPELDGLTAGMTYSKTISNNFQKSFWRKHTLNNFRKEGEKGRIWTNEILSTSESSSPGRESLSNTYSRSDNYQLNFNLSYDKSFGDHHVNALLIYEQAEYEGAYFYGTRYDFPIILKDQWFATSGDAEDSRAGGSEFEYGRLSYIGRLDYNFKEKYMVSASVRRDGSMIFAPGKRWGWFPAISAAWRVSEESFFSENVNFIDYLKLRASVGLLGDDSTSPYQWQETYSAAGSYLLGNNNSIGQAAGIRYDGIPNPNITWEKSLTTNLGVDAAFLDEKLHVTSEIWFRNQSDILWSRIQSLPSTFGANMPSQNYAEVNSNGFELELRYNDKIGSDFKYNAGVNFAYATNEVIKFDQAENTPDYKDRIGRSMDYMYTVEYTDIIRTQEDLDALPEGYRIFGFSPELGMPNYNDISGPEGVPDNKIDDYDNQVVSKRSIAPYNAGLFLGGEWKGFNFDVLFQSAFGHKKMYNGRGRESYPGIRPAAHWRDAWTADNPDGAYPKAVDWHQHSGYKNSTFWLRDGSYLRLKNINLGYTIPKSFTKILAGIDRVQFYFNATNLFVISKFTKEGWYDPELPNAEFYPNMKKFTFGVNVTL